LETAPFEPWNDEDAKPLIRFKGVQKKFGDFTAIHNLSLDIFEKEFFALLGPSGCGKTTMMRMLAGFETPTTGSIELAGQDIVGVPPNKRSVNMMFQSYALFPHLSIWDNIAFGLKRDRLSKTEIDARVEEMLRLTRLERFAKRKPHQISGIQEKTGTTFVIVTHDQEEAMTVASRVAVMDEGRLMQVSTPDVIYEAPNSVYVADFIGDVNIISGIARANGNGRYGVHWGDAQTPVRAMSERPFQDGQDCHLAIRPEKISISETKPEQADNMIEGKVLDIAYLGNLSTYHVEVSGGQIIKAQTANTRRISKRSITWEDTVWLSWTETAGVLLDQ